MEYDMKEPTGELVEVDFYFGACEDGLQRLVNHCCQHGGEFAGTVMLSEGAAIRRAPLTQGIYTFPVWERSVSAEALQSLFSDEDTRVLKVAIWSALGLTTSVPEIVTYCGMSPDAAGHDSLPVAIVSEGWVFSTPGYERQSAAAGKRCYNKLLEVCNALDPTYAAILSEKWIPCAYDLKRGRGDGCFSSFFVSESKLGRAVVSEIEDVCRDAYTEKLSTGLFVSTTRFHNPQSVHMDRATASKLSSRVAGILRCAL
jgi:hypothetical protein